MARYNVHIQDDIMAQLRALWRRTFPAHGQSFGRWLVAPRIDELPPARPAPDDSHPLLEEANHA